MNERGWYWKDWAERKVAIVAANEAISGKLLDLPAPDVPREVGYELSQRPCHGVPSSYTPEAVSLARIMIERAAGKLIAHKRAA